MSDVDVSFRHIKKLSELPKNLTRGRIYFVDDVEYYVIDHGGGPTFYGKKDADRLTSLEGRATAVEGRATTLEGRATTLESRATAVEGRATTLEKRANGHDTEDKKLQDRATSLETRATNLEGRAKTLEDRADAHDTEDKKLQDRATNLEGRATTLENTTATHTTNITALQGEDTAIKTRVTTNENNISALQSGKADKATTLAGYGITNAYTKTETDNKDKAISDRTTTLENDLNTANTGLKARVTTAESNITSLQSGKADKSTTLAGYGITNAYTKTETDNKDKAISDRTTTLESTTSTHTTQLSELDTRTNVLTYTSADLHNMLYRGKNLGKAITDEQKQAIVDGTFKDLYVGDYWDLNPGQYSNYFTIAHIMHKSNDNSMVNALIIYTPRNVKGADLNAQMYPNFTDYDIAGGYYHSYLRQSSVHHYLRDLYFDKFGEENLLSHYVLRTLAVSGIDPNTGDITSLCQWDKENDKLELMNEFQVYGYYHFSKMKNVDWKLYGEMFFQHPFQFACFKGSQQRRLYDMGYYNYGTFLQDNYDATHYLRIYPPAHALISYWKANSNAGMGGFVIYCPQS